MQNYLPSLYSLYFGSFAYFYPHVRYYVAYINTNVYTLVMYEFYDVYEYVYEYVYVPVLLASLPSLVSFRGIKGAHSFGLTCKLQCLVGGWFCIIPLPN